VSACWWNVLVIARALCLSDFFFSASRPLSLSRTPWHTNTHSPRQSLCGFWVLFLFPSCSLSHTQIHTQRLSLSRRCFGVLLERTGLPLFSLSLVLLDPTLARSHFVSLSLSGSLSRWLLPLSLSASVSLSHIHSHKLSLSPLSQTHTVAPTHTRTPRLSLSLSLPFSPVFK
jgi:hypothetical protein